MFATCCTRHHGSQIMRTFVKTVHRRPGTPIAVSSTDLIKQLRFETGAPILDCRKALKASDNDLKTAAVWLREHGAAKVAKANRDAKDGLVGLYMPDAKRAGFVQIASETDFTARSTEFISLVSKTAQAVLKSETMDANIPIDDVLQLKNEDKLVKEMVEDAIVAIRENISVANAINMKVEDGRDSFLVGYVHNRVESDDALFSAGTVAAVVELERIDQDLPEANVRAIGKKLAMHIVATPPSYLHPNEVPMEDVAKERDLLTEQVSKQKSDIREIKIVVAKLLRKYFESVCLSEQSHSIDESIENIGSGMKNLGVEIKRFKRFEV